MKFSLRKTASLTALLSFAVLAGTGIVLFLVPQGRVAFWSEWKLWRLTKENWAALHILLSLLFLVAGVIHIVLNWGPIVSYLRDRGKGMRVLTAESAVAAVLTLVFTTGALAGVAPFRWVMDFNTTVKDQASRTYGEPPYGHAEQSSLKTFSERVGLDLTQAMALLKAGGLSFQGEADRIQDIAKWNRRTPQEVYLVMKAAEKPKPASAFGELPEEAAPGLGRKTLPELCQEYHLDLSRTVAALEARRLKVSAEQPLRLLAETNGMGPHDLYSLIRQSTRKF